MHVREIAPLLLAAAMAFAPAVAQAQTPEVERLLRHGIELRQQGNNAEALAEFQRAHQLANTPRTLAQVALAEQALGRWVNAEMHLREALRSANDPWITRNRAALDGALGVIAQHVGQVMVRCDVDGAELWIGERRAGALPLTAPLRVDAGEVEVSARSGERRVSQRTRVSAGETALVTLEFGRQEATRGQETPVTVMTPPVVPHEENVSTSRPGSTQRALGWIALVGGIAGLGVGATGTILREQAAQSYNDNNQCPGENAPPSVVQGPDCQGLLNDVDTYRALQLAGFVSGGVLSLTGIILLATAPSSQPRTTAHLQCGMGPGEFGVTCRGSF